MSSMDFIAIVLKGVDEAFEPLKQSLVSIDSFTAFLSDFGWSLAVDADINKFSQAFNNVTQGLTALDQAVQTLNSNINTDQLNAVVNAINSVVTSIRGLAQINPVSLPAPLNQADFWQTFPEELLGYLAYGYIESRQPVLFGIMHFLGFLAEDPLSPPASTNRSPYLRKGVRWERIPIAVTRPSGLFADVYGWGAAFDHERFIWNLGTLLGVLSLPVAVDGPSAEELKYYYDVQAPVWKGILEIRAPFYWTIFDTGTAVEFVGLDVIVMPIPPTGSGTLDPVGFVLYPLLTGQIKAKDLKLADGVYLSLSGGFESSKAIRAEFRPDGTNIVFSTDDTSISALANLTANPASPWMLLGTSKSSSIILAKAHVSLTAARQNKTVEYKIEVGFDGLQLAVDFGEGDGFLQQLVGGGQQSLNLSTAISWSSRTGFGFSGQAPLESNIPVHLSVANVLSVDKVYAAFRPTQGNQVALQVALTGGLQLGPISAIVDRVGIQLTLEPRVKPAPPGNLGDLDLGFSFKPPNGLGILIDAGAIVGGGSITFYPDKGQYWGWLELKLENIQIKAIGLLDTHLPDGSSGYSFLIILTSTDFAPIQLGLGFTLNGVGGLAGINRTMLVDVLRAGLRNQALNAVLFPPDPVRNSQQIISDLRAIFPPVDGRYVFGPMIEIGWGVPAIITASLGVLLELPAPVQLVIIGQIKAVLPTDQATLILFHMDILGDIDFGVKKLSLDGTIYDSRIVVFPLVGDMALRLDWGDNPNFLCSVGGFHPRFQPPPNFPLLKRLTASIGSGNRLNLSLSCYQAFTSNTVQIGASFDLHANAGGFSAHGYFTFDALFIFSPFSFTAEMSAGVELRYKRWTLFGVTLDLLLSGPTPWHAHGTASIHILGFRVSVTIDVTFGNDTQASLPQTSPLEPLLDAIKNGRNWNATLPTGTEQMVTLTAATPEADTILMHPLGLLTVHESVVPLGVTITKFGEAAPAEADFLNISSVTYQGQDATGALGQPVKELLTDYLDYFASAHFSTLIDAEKLAAPSYTLMKAGVTIGTSDISQNDQDNTTLQVQYDTSIVDNLNVPGTNNGHYTLPVNNLVAFLRQGAAELSLVRTTGNAKYVVPGTVGAVKVLAPQYVVASINDLSNNTPTVAKAVTQKDNVSSFASYFEATSALRVYLAAHPDQTGMLQVMSLYEAATP